MLEKGIKGTGRQVVTEKLTAKEMGSGELAVYATPAMIALMEETAYKSVTAELEDGNGRNINECETRFRFTGWYGDHMRDRTDRGRWKKTGIYSKGL